MKGWSNQLFQLDPEIKVHNFISNAAAGLLLKILEQDYRSEGKKKSLNKYISLQWPTETEGCKPARRHCIYNTLKPINITQINFIAL